MATYSTDISFTWDGVTMVEMYSLSLEASGDRVGRSTNWRPDMGTISAACYGTAGIETTKVGKLAGFTASGGGISTSGYAICTGMTASPELNGVTKFTMTFKVID